ncbi:MAG: hypothetical protein WCI67_01860 [Chloroflexales bacterium]
MPSQETKKAIEYALAFATTGAGASFGIKTFVPIPIIDAIPQTILVKIMADQISSIYGFRSLKGLTAFTGMLVGAAGGVKLASEVTTFIPVAGPGTSAITTFALHMSVGIVLIITLELIREGTISEDYIRSATINDVGVLLGLATEVLMDIVSGSDGVGAIGAAVDKFSLQSA